MNDTHKTSEPLKPDAPAIRAVYVCSVARNIFVVITLKRLSREGCYENPLMLVSMQLNRAEFTMA